jgi:hypothetical protein
MKYIKSIKEDFNRVVGFRYSDPKESYKVSILCLGEEITKDKIERALNKVTQLKFNSESINITEIGDDMSINTPDGPILVDAIVEFELTVYTDREISGIVEELGKILLSAFDIEIVNFKYKMVLDI